MEIKSSLPESDAYGAWLDQLSAIVSSDASRATKFKRIKPLFEFVESFHDIRLESLDVADSGYDDAMISQGYSPYEIPAGDSAYASTDVLSDIASIMSAKITDIEKIARLKVLLVSSRDFWDLEEDDEPASDSSESDPNTSTSFSSPLHWNMRWQEARSLKSTAGELKYDAIRTLAADFAASAERYGKIIISEIGIPTEKKTIKPMNAGGHAGGEKYLVHGIFFKFALDFMGLYGSDRFAIKAAKHELKSLAFHMATEVEGLHYPIMCLVQYCGFCLIATCVLPISKATLSYGCDNAGTKERVVHADDATLNSLMEQAGKTLNLEGHNCDGKTIFGPMDIEAHKGTDGRYYVLDLARLFPPETKRGFLHRLLRPELVSSNATPLCSDTFTKFDDGSGPEGKAAHIKAVEAAVATIPERVKRLAQSLLQQFDNTTYLLDSSIMADLLKTEGVNTRYLGLLYNTLHQLDGVPEKETQLTWIVLVEMVSRCAAWKLNEMWRQDIKRCKHVRDTFCKAIAVKYMTDICAPVKMPPALLELVTETEEYFQIKFHASFWDTEKQKFLGKCMMRIFNLTGLQMAHSYISRQHPDTETHGWTTPDDSFDIQDIKVKVSQLPVISLAHARFTMNRLQKTPSFKRILEAANQRSLPAFRLAFANWVRFEFPVVGNVISACRNSPLHQCQAMMSMCTEASTTMFKTLAAYWLKLDSTVSNGSLLSKGLLDTGRSEVAQLFLVYAKRFLDPTHWSLLLRMTYCIVHENPVLLERGILGDPLSPDLALLPAEEVFAALTKGRTQAEHLGDLKNVVALALVEANLRLFHDSLRDKTSLMVAKSLFESSLKADTSFHKMIKPKCRFLEATGDPTILLLKLSALGPAISSILLEETKPLFSKISKLVVPGILMTESGRRKFSLHYPQCNFAILPMALPNLEEVDFAMFQEAFPIDVMCNLLLSWSASVQTIHLGTLSPSSLNSILPVLQKCKQLRTLYVSGPKDRLEKHAAAAGLSKWLGTLTLISEN